MIALEDEFGLHIRDGRMDATVTRSSSAGVWALYLHRDDPVPWTYAEERLVLRAGDVFSRRVAGVLIPLPEHAERLEVPYP